MYLLLLLACNGDSNLNKGKAAFEWEPSSIDFGEVVVSDYLDFDVTVRNTGYGHLDFTSIAMQALSDAEFSVLAYPVDGLGHNEEGAVSLRYAPTIEAQNLAILQLATNDEAHLAVDIDLQGTGVKPCVDVDPETLDFGHIEAGGTYSLPVRITACGTGTLVVEDMRFPGAESVAYRIVLPDGWETPKPIEAGDSTTFEVAFSPLTDEQYEGELQVYTNDPEETYAVVQLRGNMEGSTTNQTPIVEVFDPNNGEYYLDNVQAELNGHVVDDQAVEDLICIWSSEDEDGATATLASGAPASDGTVTASALLPPGNITVTLRCIDPENAVGQDMAEVTVWPGEGPFLYTLSGGSSMLDWIDVDDDLEVQLNGTTIYLDNDGGDSSLPPIEFEASVGDTLRVIATDDHENEAILDAMYLHFGPGVTQPINEARICLSMDSSHECYSGDYVAGQWPYDFYDHEETITIP